MENVSVTLISTGYAQLYTNGIPIVGVYVGLKALLQQISRKLIEEAKEIVGDDEAAIQSYLENAVLDYENQNPDGTFSVN
jgi:hypothetical protein